MSNTQKWEVFEDRSNTISNQIKWFWQRITRGFDDREIHNLSSPLAKFIQPRLALFVEWQTEHGFDYPSDLLPEEWLEVLRKMDNSFTSWQNLAGGSEMTDGEKEGLVLFGKYINHLLDMGNPRL